MLKIALIGAGNIAGAHLASYQKLTDRMKVVAICDINEARLNKMADKFGIEKRYLSIEDLLANEKDLDAADVCVWNCNHAKCTIAALNAGLHVLCEKPMACSSKEAEEMKACAEKNNKLLMVGFVTRFTNAAKILKDFIDNDYLGDIYFARAQYVRRHGSPRGWFGEKARSGGGPLIDIGVHVIDRAIYLMGSPKPVSVYAATFDNIGCRPELKNRINYHKDGLDTDVYDVEDLALATIRFDNGAVLQVEASFDINLPSAGSMVLAGTKGGFFEDEKNPVLYTNINGYMTNVSISTDDYIYSDDSFRAQFEHFADSIEGKCKCGPTALDGVNIMKLLEAIYESAKTGHEVIMG